MATVEEVLAKAWEAAGRPGRENAAKLRAYAETLPKAVRNTDAATVEAKAAEWEKPGTPKRPQSFWSYAATLPKVDPIKEGPVAVVPVRTSADRRTDARQPVLRNFEEANPILKGRYTVENFPSVGAVVIFGAVAGKVWCPLHRPTLSRFRQGGYLRRHRRRDGGRPRRWNESSLAASGGPSLSRDYLANDPLTKTCPARF